MIKTKTPNSFWLKNKQMLYTTLAIINLLLGLNYGVVAQNVSYNANSVPIGGNTSSAFGYEALKSNTGSSNTASGYRALYSNTTGDWNMASGVQALRSNTTGYDNTASGVRALFSNATGHRNVASGVHALFSNTTGYYNTASGFDALYSNTTGSGNTALGIGADVTKGDLTNATAIGANAKVNESNAIQLGDSNVTKVYAGVDTKARLIAGGLQVTSGSPAAGKILISDADGIASWQTPNAWGLTGNAGTVDSANFIGTTDNVPLNIKVNNVKAGRIDEKNAFYGYQSSNNLTTGNNNTSIGSKSLYNTTSGSNNTANGRAALYSNTTGQGNTASGESALYNSTDGSFNTASGVNALVSNIAGNNNTAIGFAADVSTANLNSTIAIGYKTTVGGNNATAVGAGAKAEGLNSTAIGYAASVKDDNKIVIGNSTIMSIGGFKSWTNLSDSRVKKDIKETVPGLSFINKLRPITYHLNMDAIAKFLNTPNEARLKNAEAIKELEVETGFLAQEVEKAAQELNFEFSGVDKPKNQNGLYGLRYAAFTVPLVKAVQELDKKNEQKDKQIDQLQQQLQQQQQQIDELKKLITGTNSLTQQPANTEDISLYPNPTTGIFTIIANNITNATIEIYDALGNKVKKDMLTNIKSGYQLNLSGYAKGTYWINIIAGNKKYTKQIILQ